MLRFLTSLMFACAMLFAGATASAQTLVPPPPKPPAPLWSGYFPGDPGTWPSPDAACKAQHDYYNPNATLQPADYNGGIVAHCNWQLNDYSNTILPALAYSHCATGWYIMDPGICARGDPPRDGRMQCGCGDQSQTGSPKPELPNPIALNYAATVEHETDYASADGRLAVKRDYYSLGEDYYNVSSPTPVVGFGARWHGVVPGRLAVTGGYAEYIEYLKTDGSFMKFRADAPQDLSTWAYHPYPGAGVRLRFSMVAAPSASRTDYFYTQSAVLNGAAEVRLDMARGEYILFRRSGTTHGVRYLVPIEHGYADGYKLFYTYPDTAEFPSTVSDSLGRQMTLTWADADRLDYQSLSAVVPIKVISAIALPDGTSLQYNYGYGTDDLGSTKRDRLEGVKRLSATGAILWARSFLYENAAVSHGLTGELDQNGNRILSHTYDAAGLATSSELAGGVNRYTLVNLEEQGAPTFWRQVTNPLGHRTDYVFANQRNTADAERVLTSVSQYADNGVAASSTSFAYNGYVGDQVVRDYQNEKGLTLHFDTDSQLRPTLIREASGTADARTTNVTWHPVFDLPTHEDRPGLSADYTYSTTGLLLTKTETDTTTQTVPYSTAGQTRTWTYNWNGNGRLLSVNGPKGLDATGHDDITSFTYDSSGNLLTSTDAMGVVSQFSNYDANGRPGLLTDPNGVQTIFAYDALGHTRTITVKDPAGTVADAVTTFNYDIEGRVIGVKLPGTPTRLIIDYDLAGQVTAVSSFGAEQIAYSHDAMGNVTATTVKRADTTTARAITRTFDGLGRLLSQTLGTNRTTSFSYDNLGNATTVTGARSNATIRAFDGLNRLISTVAPDTGTTATNYDVRSNPVSFTDPKTVTTTFVRDGFGDVIREISPDRGTSTYYYDAAGDRIASIDGRGQRIDYVRDALGRVTSKTPAGRPASEIVTYTYATAPVSFYYVVGRLASVTDGTGTTYFRYDPHGNVTMKRQSIGATSSAKLSYLYDLADRITSITYPSGRIVTYVRDTRGRVTSVTTQANATAPVVTLASGITYEAFGSMLSATLGNGLTMAQSWGNDGRLASKRLYQTSSGTNLSSLTYGYDNDDNITSIADGVDPTRSITYAYDPVNRLTQSVAASGSVRQQDFVFDVNGNRTRVEQRVNPGDPTPLSTAIYSLNSGTNQLATVTDPAGTRAISYDARGNTAGETRPGAVAITTGYDGYGRLTSYQTSGAATLTNTYNGLDDRVQAGTAADMRTYVYDPDGRMMGEYGVSATDVKAETIWLSPEVNGGDGQMFGGDDGVGGYAPLAVATSTAGTLYWVHGNHLGVPIVVTDSAGNLAAPTGYTLAGFPGQTRTLADLFYNRYRDYDPTTGRYIQADPIGLGGGSNPYSYAMGNPLRYTDPHGKFIQAMAIGAVAFFLADLAKQLLWDHRSPGCLNWWELGGSFVAGGLLGGGAGWLLGGGAVVAAAAEGGGAAAAAAEGGAAAAAAAEGGGGAAAAAAEGGEAAAAAAEGGEATIGEILAGSHPDTMIHLTNDSASAFSAGVDQGTFFAKLGDVSEMTVPQYQSDVVGMGAAAGPGQPVSGFITAGPGNAGAFAQAGTWNNAGIMEYTNGVPFIPHSFVPLP